MDDPRLPAVAMTLHQLRSPNVDRRDAEHLAEIEAAAREYLAVFDTIKLWEFHHLDGQPAEKGTMQ